MTSDRDIEQNVKEELQWNPDLDASDIAVSVKDGVVTLAGFVKSYTDKYEAEAAAKRVAGYVALPMISRCGCPRSTSGRIRKLRVMPSQR